MDCVTLDFPILHYLPELDTDTEVILKVSKQTV